MAEELAFMADNLFSQVLYPSHTPSADEEASGYTVDRIANGRRQTGDSWRATTANADHYVQVRCNQPRGANCLIIDRASNHLGQRFQLLGSDDAFTSSRTVFDITLPSVPGGALDGALGCVTEEDAWIKVFTADAHYDWKLVSKAMGAGVIPRLTGVWLGFMFLPTEKISYQDQQDEASDVSSNSVTSPYQWRGKTFTAAPRGGVHHLKHGDQRYYDIVRQQILGVYRKHPAWYVPLRTSYPQRAMQITMPDSRLSWGYDNREWPGRTLELPFVEDQPRPL